MVHVWHRTQEHQASKRAENLWTMNNFVAFLLTWCHWVNRKCHFGNYGIFPGLALWQFLFGDFLVLIFSFLFVFFLKLRTCISILVRSGQRSRNWSSAFSRSRRTRRRLTPLPTWRFSYTTHHTCTLNKVTNLCHLLFDCRLFCTTNTVKTLKCCQGRVRKNVPWVVWRGGEIVGICQI